MLLLYECIWFDMYINEWMQKDIARLNILPHHDYYMTYTIQLLRRTTQWTLTTQ